MKDVILLKLDRQCGYLIWERWASGQILYLVIFPMYFGFGNSDNAC